MQKPECGYMAWLAFFYLIGWATGFYRGVNQAKKIHVHDWGPWTGCQGVIRYPQIRFCKDPACGKKEVG